MTLFKNKRVLITGGAGSIGSAIAEKLLRSDAQEIIIIDNNETEVFLRLQEYKGLTGYVGDIVDRDFVFRIVKDIDIVIHAAALKHVILGERSPDSSVRTNINGLQNLLDAALQDNVENFVFTSSDKAVNPTNVMGTSKLMGERLVTATNSKKRSEQSIFYSARFGNVIGSRGGVFDIFKEQISEGGPLTITDPEMTRFIMSIDEAADLILESLSHAQGGEVFITKMPVMRIPDLAQAMINEFAPLYDQEPSDISTTVIGKKPGEKLYEELMSDEEVTRAHELEDFYVVLPAFRAIYQSVDYSYLGGLAQPTQAYNSSNAEAFSIEQIQSFLQRSGLVTVED